MASILLAVWPLARTAPRATSAQVGELSQLGSVKLVHMQPKPNLVVAKSALMAKVATSSTTLLRTPALQELTTKLDQKMD